MAHGQADFNMRGGNCGFICKGEMSRNHSILFKYFSKFGINPGNSYSRWGTLEILVKLFK